MNMYAVLIRGINVGGNNAVPMGELRDCLHKAGFTKVSTHLNSGNVILESDKSAALVEKMISEILVSRFALDARANKVLVLSREQLLTVVDSKPTGFGEQPEKYYYDVIFLIDIDTETAIQVFQPRKGIDEVWQGRSVIYSSRLAAERNRSRLNRVAGTDAYKSMTIRTLNTVVKLLAKMT